MKKKLSSTSRGKTKAAKTHWGAGENGKIHPVIIFPFRQGSDYADLQGLYQLVARLNHEKSKYARPITVIDRKTHYAMEQDKTFLKFRENTVGKHSDILDAWC